MKILGVSCYYHDSTAALIIDGQVIAAAEEERFTGIKHDSSFPAKAIKFCLDYAGLKSTDMDYAVFYEKPFLKFQRIILSSLKYYPKSYRSFRESMLQWLTKKLWIKDEIANHLKIDSKKVLFSIHHLSHAAGCFYPSPFNEAAILTIDGLGEWTTASYGLGIKNKIEMLKELRFPESLGLFYSTFTAFLGFEVNEGEWKVMGLSPYGKPVYKNKIWKMIKLNKDGSFSLDMSYFSYQYSDSVSYSPKFVELFGNPINPAQSHIVTKRSADIAASIQAVSEEIVLHMAKSVKKETGMNYLCYSGGVALNSVINYRLLKDSGFKNIYIPSAPGDSGGAIGAALVLYHQVLGNKKGMLSEMLI